ncbi:MAG: PSD1 and planctomycete cytochrome C domain-containing protein [Verrucomicrobia bacterium]|nr:PSD1 and planctomycete cytochrome C domain-containing protein [Verrucomicrobiota bacterium]
MTPHPFVIRFLRTAIAAAVLPATLASAANSDAKPDFSRDVRPILSKNCFQCHGPDSKALKGKLRLDTAEHALDARDGGMAAITPGAPDKSALILRIFASDPDDIMPPPETKKELTAAEKETLRQWIASGAEYEPHWAFEPPQQPPLPAITLKDWPRNSIDHFILARLESQGLSPSPRADRDILIRRLYLDLIGLPPTPEELAELQIDSSPASYERLVDHLLALPQYGERWARRWLDLARYADTNGYEKDRPRSIWPYRDWVINALNRDMPFDRFTIAQIAGDMLPGASVETRIATGFHRNTMLNEEGGIDPLEFRFHAMTDRVATTGKTWLGLTIGCAQCHTHKFDPIPQREYYQFMAFLNNANEPDLDVPDPAIAEKRNVIQTQIRGLIRDLPNRFPVHTMLWQPLETTSARNRAGTAAESLEDHSLRFPKDTPTDVYSLEFDLDLERIDQIQLEALIDDALPGKGPGRSSGGNFVLSEISLTAAPRNRPEEARALRFKSATSDFSQNGYEIAHAIDGKPETGWAIHGPDKPNVDRTATFTLEQPLLLPGGIHLKIELSQLHGDHHTLGRIRMAAGRIIEDPRPIETRRRERLDRSFIQWLAEKSKQSVDWTVLHPEEATSNLPLLTVLEDDSVLASGDQTKSDTYHLRFKTDVEGIRAIRLEAMADDRLPRHGPGRVYYEGPIGDFTLCEFNVRTDGHPAPIGTARHSFASGNFTAQAAIDANPQTGWSINGGQGRSHAALFELASPVPKAGVLEIDMLFERHFSAGLGRFRISVTTGSRPADAQVLDPEIERLSRVPEDQLTEAQQETLFQAFLLETPELAAEHARLAELKNQLPDFPTTLVMEERPDGNPRPTFIHNRGEFLQPTEQVHPGVLSVLQPLPPDEKPSRLAFARWLVSPSNPLVARVTVNRQWSALFGSGIVTTEEDFGYQGNLPSHPKLLDWLSVEFINQAWSLKKLHKLIVMSATYQQASRVSDALLKVDPDNRLLARGPRVRLEAELIRDSLLTMAGLLSPRLGGPSVFPPQPANITTEGAYGRLAWKTSPGADRYRRGLYTFSKRTAPYAMFSTFDGPSGEACIAIRETSNTPLQALTLLNDEVLTEAARATGRMMTARSGSIAQRLHYLFQRCLTRHPQPDELKALEGFYTIQEERFRSGSLDAGEFAGEGASHETAAWTAVARALFNLDETITKG